MAVILGKKTIEGNPYISSSFTPPCYPHSHEFFEISFCVTGHSVNTVNGLPISFQNGTCVILRPGDVHSLTEYDKTIYEHIDLYVSKETFENICNCCHKDLYQKIMQQERPLYFSLSNEMFSFLFNQSLFLKEMIANNNAFFQTLHISLVSLIVSEETGIISIAKAGKIERYADSKMLNKVLKDYYWQEFASAKR